MNGVIIVAYALLSMFEPHIIREVESGALTFPARTRVEGPADLFILDGHELRIHSVSGRPVRTLTLPQGASVFDVAVHHDDRDKILVVIHGDRVLGYSLADDANDAPVELFRLRTALSIPAAQPQPYVLTTRMGNRTVLALPTADALELRRLSGELEARYPAKLDPDTVPFGPPFSAWPVDPVQAGPQDSLEMRVSRVQEPQIELPPELKSQAPTERPYRRVTPSQLAEMANLGPESWPWFPLRDNGDNPIRVLYAPALPDMRDTLVRIRHAPTSADESQRDGVTLLPIRRYPGLLMDPAMDMPDFNGNGYVDLILWSAPQPGGSVDSIIRTLVGRTWPVRITLHYYDPARGRHEAQPNAVITCRLPVLWLMLHEEGVPMRNVVLRDFTGDGRADCAWSPNETEFHVWQSRESGFSDRPDRVYPLPEGGMRIEHRIDFDGAGRTSIVLRGESTLLWLYARPPD